MVLKYICAKFKGLPNGVNFNLIDLWVGELLLINKASSEHGCLINASNSTAVCWVLSLGYSQLATSIKLLLVAVIVNLTKVIISHAKTL